MIDSLSKEVLETDLSHIQGRDIVNCNIVALANLLEIFMGLLEYIFEELEREDMMKEQGWFLDYLVDSVHQRQQVI